MVVLNDGELNPRVGAQKDIQIFNRCRWNWIKYPSERVDRKTEIEIETEICPVYSSKYNPTCKKQITLLMIPNGIIWHHLAVKKLFALLRRVTLELLCQLKKIIY